MFYCQVWIARRATRPNLVKPQTFPLGKPSSSISGLRCSLVFWMSLYKDYPLASASKYVYVSRSCFWGWDIIIFDKLAQFFKCPTLDQRYILHMWEYHSPSQKRYYDWKILKSEKYQKTIEWFDTKDQKYRKGWTILTYFAKNKLNFIDLVRIFLGTNIFLDSELVRSGWHIIYNSLSSCTFRPPY